VHPVGAEGQQHIGQSTHMAEKATRYLSMKLRLRVRA
jgi:hypothetical protein